MYRLTLYYLVSLLLLGVVLAATGVLPSTVPALIWTTGELLAVCWLTSVLLSRLSGIPANKESALITGLILALIVDPVWLPDDPGRAGVIAIAGVVAILSKYLIPPRRQHIFNPAAFGVFVIGIAFQEYASWWVGTAAMLPFVALGGVLILRKTTRIRMVGIFLAAVVVFLAGISLIQGLDVPGFLMSLKFDLVNTELVFLAVVMLTEPATSPKQFRWRVVYASIVALLALPQFSIGGFSFSPEMALLIGNVFSYFTVPGYKLALTLLEREKIGTDTLEFVFSRPPRFRFRAGQYMEWTIPLRKSDSRGNRRYFTIASAPDEETLRIAARFHDHSSEYKTRLAAMEPGDTIVATDLAGEFVLPNDTSIPLVFIAGGIGITPYRSMIAQMQARRETRSVVLLYSNYGPDEIAYRDLFSAAEQCVGLKTVYTLTDQTRVPDGWRGACGFVDATMIRKAVPDYDTRLLYVSGSQGFVEYVKRALANLGVRRSMIRTDFFPGYVR